jgi:hypothetical protein
VHTAIARDIQREFPIQLSTRKPSSEPIWHTYPFSMVLCSWQLSSSLSLPFLSHNTWCQRLMMESPSEGSTRGQSLSGLDGRDVVDDDDTLTTLIGTSGLRGGFAVGQATVTTCPSGSGDQQLSDSQHPITTVTRPISSASIM